MDKKSSYEKEVPAVVEIQDVCVSDVGGRGGGVEGEVYLAMHCNYQNGSGRRVTPFFTV